MNVTNHQLNISETCSEDVKENIQKYWKIENNEFSNKPKNIAESLEIPIHEISILVRKYSEFTFEIACERCNTNIKHTVFSQTAYNSITRKSSFICKSCLDLIAEKERIEEEKARQQKIKLLSDAIENKHWEQLNRFEFKLLHNIILENDLNRLKKRYSNVTSNTLWSAIYKMRDLHLIVLDYNNWGNSVTDILFLKELPQNLPDVTVIDNDIIEEKDTSFNKETNELRFKLTKNPNAYGYDSPEYSGTLEFNQNIVLKPGIEYSFGAWKRQNEVLYLSIIPTEDKPLLPKQKNKAW